MEDKDLSLRFPAAMTRFATYGDVAGTGGASAGSKWGTSVNPASTAWLDIDSQHRMSLCPQYSLLHFDNGADFNVFAESLTIQTDKWGAVMPAAAQIETNHSTMKNGLGFDFSARLFQLQWAAKTAEDWAVGANLNYTGSTTNLDMGPFPIAESNSDCYGVRLGALHRLCDKLLGGVVLDYGISRDRTVMYGIPALGISETHDEDTTQQIVARPGLAFEYKKDSQVLVDYQYGTFWNSTGNLQVHRLFAGVDHGLTDWLYLRAGTAVDVEGNTAVTCGLGLYPAKWLSIDVGYQCGMFPEMEPEFGRSQTLTASLGFTF